VALLPLAPADAPPRPPFPAEPADPDPGPELVVPEHPIAPRITNRPAEARTEPR
jgi:hypothetical protein